MFSPLIICPYVKMSKKICRKLKKWFRGAILTLTRVINYKIIRKFVSDFAVLWTVTNH